MQQNFVSWSYEGHDRLNEQEQQRCWKRLIKRQHTVNCEEGLCTKRKENEETGKKFAS